MDFGLSKEEEDFRQDVRGFFIQEKATVAEARKEWDSGQGFGPYCWDVLGKIGTKGWLCPTWPKRYGGLELPYIYRYIVQEQMHYYTNISQTIATTWAGPMIFRHGSEDQKNRLLPRIARGEIEFTLGYTEPQAGCDLASIEMKAEDRGDHFLIHGQKTFNTRVHYSQYHWLAARTEVTDPKRDGISLFIVDLGSPGISISADWTLWGSRTNQVFYDEVKVPRESMVGEKNRGFHYIQEAQDHERISITSGLERDFQELCEYVRETGMGKNVLVRQKIAELAIDVEAARIFSLRVASILDSGKVPSYEACMLKIVMMEAEQELVNTAMQILGPYGLLKDGSKWAPLKGKFEWRYRNSLETLLTMGTSEIMRNVVAQRGLGLPRV